MKTIVRSFCSSSPAHNFQEGLQNHPTWRGAVSTMKVVVNTMAGSGGSGDTDANESSSVTTSVSTACQTTANNSCSTSKKRKAIVASSPADAIDRLLQSSSSEYHVAVGESKVQYNDKDLLNHQGGRGSVTGWVTCPLCASISHKKYALGRGIANHIQTVHQPWNPGRLERKKRRRNKILLLEQRKRASTTFFSSSQSISGGVQQVVSKEVLGNDDMPIEHEQGLGADDATWHPTREEIDAWNAKVLELIQKIEQEAIARRLEDGQMDKRVTAIKSKTILVDELVPLTIVPAGMDRNGDTSIRYRQSLPEILQCAANGQLDQLQRMVENARSQGTKALVELLNCTDRHMSTAEHWAAGSGHLECLKFLVDTRDQLTRDEKTARSSVDNSTAVVSDSNGKPKVRRRDGKTALHYAARNGHVNCIIYLLREKKYPVDDVSGDGTTPLHLSCFGGHLEAFEILVEHGANVQYRNEWGCGAAHWMGMTRCASRDDVWKFCNRLVHLGVSFVERQKQGHTPLHKAAQRKNRHVIEWLATSKHDGGAGLSDDDRREIGKPDAGGHTPSDIWLSVRGDESFAKWMRDERQW